MQKESIIQSILKRFTSKNEDAMISDDPFLKTLNQILIKYDVDHINIDNSGSEGNLSGNSDVQSDSQFNDQNHD